MASNVARHIQIIMKTMAVVQSCVYAMRPTYVIKIQQKSSENNEYSKQRQSEGEEGKEGGHDGRTWRRGHCRGVEIVFKLK